VKRSAIASLAAAMLLASFAAAEPAATVASAASAASDRTAVFIACGAGTDAALGDNLSEVAIARLAERFAGERVGTHELRRWVEKSGHAESVPACVSRAPCMRRLGAELGVRKIISGSVLADGGEFTVALTLVDAESGAVDATSTRTVSGELEEVIRVVQDAVVELLQPRSAAPRLALTAPPAGPAVALVREGPADFGAAPAAPRGWPFYVGLGAAAGAVVSLSAAGVFAVLAAEDPTGATRADAQRDLATREAYGGTANTLWIVAGALAATAIGMFVWPRRH
jgi:hypothetical protein